MNLLGAILYDPSSAGSVVTTSLTAMTAFDTTNLRLAFTIPTHGLVKVRLAVTHTASTTIAQVLLGIMDGSNIRARVSSQANLLQTAIASSQVKLEADFVISGLVAGAVSWDAAYAVQVVASASGVMKWGGANTNGGNNAWGAFVFEVWDPRPLTLALAGGVNVTQWLANAVTAATNGGCLGWHSDFRLKLGYYNTRGADRYGGNDAHRQRRPIGRADNLRPEHNRPCRHYNNR